MNNVLKLLCVEDIKSRYFLIAVIVFAAIVLSILFIQKMVFSDRCKGDDETVLWISKAKYKDDDEKLKVKYKDAHSKVMMEINDTKTGAVVDTVKVEEDSDFKSEKENMCGGERENTLALIARIDVQISEIFEILHSEIFD